MKRRALLVLTLSFALGAPVQGAAAATQAAPANDPFSGALTLSGASGTASGTNVGATREPGEPKHTGNAGGASVWYAWTAPSAGTTTITTAGSSFDTLLAVYRGTSVSALSWVAANDDVSSTDRTSSVTFTAAAGTTYRIAVDGYLGSSRPVATGTVVLNWAGPSASPPPPPPPPPPSGPANDPFASPAQLTSASGSLTGSNSGATREPGEPNHAGQLGGASVWYAWQAPGSGQVTVETTGSSFDTTLAVYTGTTVSALTTIASDDDGSTNYTSKLTFTATAGTTYRIAVDGYRSSSSSTAAQGSVSLRWSSAAPPPPPSPSDPVLLAAGDIGDCNSPWPAKTAALVSSYPSATVATLGDTAYESGTAAEFANCFAPMWGAFKDRTRPAVGNHEYFTPGAAPYFDYFGAVAGDRTQGWYSYDLGAWHVVVLNSSCGKVAGCGIGDPQYNWLQADLAAHPAQCTLAYYHEPRFTSGALGNAAQTQRFWELLYSAGADVVLAGHDHSYERFAPQAPSGAVDSARGIREFVVGTGGDNELVAWGTIQPGSEVRSNTTYGVLKLTLHPASYDWQFLPVAGQTFTDSGTAACH